VRRGWKFCSVKGKRGEKKGFWLPLLEHGGEFPAKNRGGVACQCKGRSVSPSKRGVAGRGGGVYLCVVPDGSEGKSCKMENETGLESPQGEACHGVLNRTVPALKRMVLDTARSHTGSGGGKRKPDVTGRVRKNFLFLFGKKKGAELSADGGPEEKKTGNFLGGAPNAQPQDGKFFKRAKWKKKGWGPGPPRTWGTRVLPEKRSVG